MNGHKGYRHTDEHNKYMLEIMSGRESPMKGKKQTDEVKKKISDAAKKMWKKRKESNMTQYGVDNKVIKCSHCGKTGSEAGMRI